MDRVVLAAVLIVVAAAVAFLLRRRRPEPPTQPAYQVPAQLDRADFDGPERPWLIVVFSSATCPTCAEVLDAATAHATADVVVQEVSYQAHRGLHHRYSIEAAPTTVVADGDGVVRAAWVGRFDPSELGGFLHA